MRVLVVGGGAIGCFLAVRLAAAGAEVTLAARPGAAQQMASAGLRLHEPDGAVLAPPVRVMAGIAAALHGMPAPHLVVIAVKSYHTEAAALELRERLSPSAAVLTVQNGVGNEEILAAHLPHHPVLAAALTTPVEVLGPGQVRVARPSFRLGLAPGPRAGDLRATTELFRAAGFKTQVFADYRGLKWTKLLMNMLANVQAAILAFTPAQIFAHRPSGDLEVLAWQETLAVMQGLGIRTVSFAGYPLPVFAPLILRLPAPSVRPVLGRLIVGGRGSKMPSLYYDLYPHPRPQSEVGWLNGAVVAVAGELKLAVPVNTALVQIFQDLLVGREERPAWAGQPDRLAAWLGRVRAAQA